ncbi:HNH endonuclease [Mucilaginibacter ginsenosidivorans]|uniref:HNH endonuclease n=1 Tax=Mucilaginibacter ginsenosidivorans TaxID=398053 RepID=A0A5B8V2K5_9SPHI|nr:HNH endonuclease [Mucilaginibacter ginsenosidivorans]
MNTLCRLIINAVLVGDNTNKGVGITPPDNEAHVDHIKKKSDGGSGTPNNGRVRCRKCNIGDQ